MIRWERCCQFMQRVIVIGGGASGMAAAISAAECGDHVLLVEKSPRLGRKVAASGNGRCNLMNAGANRYYGDADFAAAVLEHCSRTDLIRFWRRYGLLLTEESEGRIYPNAMKSDAVLQALKSGLHKHLVDIHLQESVLHVQPRASGFRIRTDQSAYEAERVIVATGGLAQQKLGGSGDGYQFLTRLGHELIPPQPALVPLRTDPKSVAGLAGIRVRAGVRLLLDDRLLHQESGEVLFTETGVSGICIMQCGRFIQPGCVLELDFTPQRIYPDPSDFDQVWRHRLNCFQEESPLDLLNGIVLPKLSFAICKQAGIPLRGETVSQLTPDQISRIRYSFEHYCLQVTGSCGFDQAQVTAGGILCRGFTSDTLRSLDIPGLHAVGEVLNVDGDCGGFNLMFAFASGILAGRNGRTVEEKGRDLQS